MKRLVRQFSAFAGVGFVAAAVHYGAMIGLVETGLLDPVKSALVGYVFGGISSYSLNRRWAFDSERSHGEATWRFAIVAGVGFVITGLFMTLFHEKFDLPYVPSAVATSAIVLFWSFFANRLWTFSDAR